MDGGELLIFLVIFWLRIFFPEKFFRLIFSLSLSCPSSSAMRRWILPGLRLCAREPLLYDWRHFLLEACRYQGQQSFNQCLLAGFFDMPPLYRLDANQH